MSTKALVCHLCQHNTSYLMLAPYLTHTCMDQHTTQGRLVGLCNSGEPEGHQDLPLRKPLSTCITESLHFGPANTFEDLLITEKETKTHHGP